MTEKKPIVLKNVRLSYPSIRRPSEDAPRDLGHRIGWWRGHNPQLDLYALGAMLAPKQKAAPKKAPPAYLKHDPTKRHKRRH